VGHDSLAVVVTHPIQYQAPLFRRLVHDGIELRVYFGDDISVRGGKDPSFGVPVAWDTGILEGYAHIFVKNLCRFERHRGFLRVCCPDIGSQLARGKHSAMMITAYDTLYQWTAITAAWRQKLPCIYRGEVIDNPLPPRPWYRSLIREALYRVFYPRCAAIMPIGRHARAHFLKHGVPENKLFDAPYCVDSDFFERQAAYFLPQRDAIRAEFSSGDPVRIILFSGKLIARKNPLLLYDAVRRLPDAQRYQLLYLGDGEQRWDLERRAMQAGGPTVRILGFKNQTEMGRYYAAADLFVLPSWREEWGLVVNEALHFGLPVIVADRVTCHHDLVRNNETGLIFPAGDEKALSRCIAQITSDTVGTARMRARARELMREYTVEAAARGVARAFEHALVAR
jgi:glycosyltransferase involved in cell wall biosynthesis